MKLESVSIQNFRCFGPDVTKIELERTVTSFVGTNGSGKTAVFFALLRLFGVTSSQRTIKRQDFHIAVGEQTLSSGATISIEVLFAFPELDGLEEDVANDAVPEFFNQMAASAPGEPLKVRMRLQATWFDDGTPEGSIEEDCRWITTLDDNYEWDDCTRVQIMARSSIQLVYVPAARDAVGQVTSLLKGRLWQAAKWSDHFREDCVSGANYLQDQFNNEEPAHFMIDRFAKHWRQVHDADTDTSPALRLVESRFEELVRKAEFILYPDEIGRERAIADLSDGQRSLFHISLAAATLEAEKDVFGTSADECFFDQDKLKRVYLTILAIEEPENNLSPFYLSRIVKQARKIGAFSSAQVALSSHSPAILSRIEPEEVRYFRLIHDSRCADVRRLTLPEAVDEASPYVRLAVRAYPELYFARFVILAEGDSEHIVIPRISEAKGTLLDISFVPIVPLGGRYVSHFWRLLNDLGIPHATLLDLDLGRAHGGVKLISDVVEKLGEIGKNLNENSLVKDQALDLSALPAIQDDMLIQERESNNWIKVLRSEGVFLSFPLDIDFAMLQAFPNAYRHPAPGGRGPRSSDTAIQEKKIVTLKTGGKPSLYGREFNDEFKWYPYLFLNRSKPETHIAALARIEGEAENTLATNAPPELIDLIDHIKDVLGLEEEE